MWKLEASAGAPWRQETLGRAGRESRLFEGGCISGQTDDLTIRRDDALEGWEHHRVTKKGRHRIGRVRIFWLHPSFDN